MKLTYRPEIDGLRAIAVGAVILYHAQITIFGHQPFKGGFIGVDIFFVISGYLITSIILKELVTTGAFSFKHFYERRIRRILPALLFVMLASLPFAWMYLLPSSFVDFSKSILYSLGFSSNFYFHYSGQQYGAESGLLKPFLHTWSLSVEEQYYILFPIVLLITFKYFRNYLIHILILGFIISLGLAEWTSRNYSSLSFYFLHTRMWELLAGSILAYFEITKGHRSNNQTLNLMLPSVGLFLIGHSILFFHDKMFHPSFYTLSSIIGVCLIIWFSQKDELITKLLSTKLFVGVGLISYSLYLWHYPIFAFYRYSFAKGSLSAVVMLIVILFVISITSYYLIEKKFRNKKNKFKTLFSFICYLIFLLILINIYIINKAGFANKAIVDGIHLDSEFYKNEILRWKSEYVYKNNLNKEDKAITIVGDSHAKNFALLFETNSKLFPNFKFLTININKFYDLLNDRIVDYNLINQIKNSDVIIFSLFYDEIKLSKVKDSIKLIKKKNNNKIILTTNNPVYNLYGSRFTDLDFFLIKKKRKPSFGELAKLEKQYYEFYNNNVSLKYFDNELKKLSIKYNIKLLDKSLYQCDMVIEKCEILTDDNKKINWDSDHHTLHGAKYLGKKIYNLNWFQID